MTWPLVKPVAGYITLSRLESESRRPSTSTSTREATYFFAAVFFFFEPEPPLPEAALFLGGVLEAAIEASRAAIRSGTSFFSATGSSIVIVSPAALRSIRSSTRSRYWSRYRSEERRVGKDERP